MLHSVKQVAKLALPVWMRNRLRKAHSLASLAWRDTRYDLLGSVLPLKPRAISMMVNDICNSRCQMCLIWERKKDHEITLDELRQVLDEPLFSKVTDIGVTGGEPTLRKDLPEIFRVIAQRNPRIDHASIITNAVREKEVEDRVLECAQVCRENGVGFSVMVSLDGLGEVHDVVRGRAGNFATAIGCLEKFKAEGVPVSFGCTITKSNVAHVDELLDWAEENRIYGRFRVAEFIDRLYNARQASFIRSFSDLEKYHLGVFFYRAEMEFESSSMVQKTYRSIRGMLAEGKPRTTGCPYHHDAVILTSRGELLYCSPKSPNLGSVLVRGSAGNVYFGNLNKRREIREKHCDDCIHDYHVPVTFREKVRFYRESRRRSRLFDCKALVSNSSGLSAASAMPSSKSLASSHVLIVGWYGTETAGDKAILASVVDRLNTRERAPTKITIASLHPFVTRRTLEELGLSRLRIVETFGQEFIEACRTSEEVVVGGGPLMDLEVLSHILYAFIEVRRRNGITRVEGCGVGPLSNPRFVQAVGEILRLANVITLRDKQSAIRCQNEFGRQAEVVEDPAADYVRGWRARSNPASLPSSDTYPAVDVACFLRDWGMEYSNGLPAAEFGRRKDAFETGLEQFLGRLVQRHNLRVGLFPMHSFSVGGDDRKFNRGLARRSIEKYSLPAGAFFVANLPMSPPELLHVMQRSRVSVCMRFHSVLFAETLGVPYLAIDYTGGGKIRAFLEERDKLNRLLTPEQVATGRMCAVFDQLLPSKH